MGKHKSKQKADFQKIKLRLGRVIKRPNDTDTNFKFKRIMLQEQLKNSDGRFDEQKEGLIEDYLKGLSQISLLRKTAALKKIKELVISKSPQIDSNLKEIVEKGFAKVLDPNARVRDVALDFVSTVFNTLSEDQMIPHYATLRCITKLATSSLDKGVRKNVLKFIDVVMEKYPKALSDSACMFKNFLNMISYQSCVTSSTKLKKSTQKTRRLIATPMEDITAQEWRITVLKCFTQFLEAINNNLKKDIEKPSEVEFDFDRNKFNMALVCHFEYDLATIFTPICETSGKESDSLTNAKILEFYTSFLPLISDIWKEVVPQWDLRYSRSHETVPYESRDVMSMILQLLQQLATWINIKPNPSRVDSLLEHFKDFCAPLVVNVFMEKFPFSFPFSMIRNGDHVKMSELRLNVMSCEIYALVVLGTTKCSPEHREGVLKYLSLTLTENDDDVDTITSTLTTLKHFLKEDVDEACEENLSVLLNIWRKDDDDEIHEIIADFFQSLALDTDFFLTLRPSKAFNTWLKEIVKELTVIEKSNTFDSAFLFKMKKIAALRYPSFVEAVQEHSKLIVKLMSSKREKMQDLAINLIDLIETLDWEHFHKIAEAIKNPKVAMTNVKFLLNKLHTKMYSMRYNCFRNEDYWSFLSCILIGICPRDSISWLNKETETLKAISNANAPKISKFVIIPVKDCSRHDEILEIVMLQFVGSAAIQKGIEDFIPHHLMYLLDKCDHFPDYAIATIFEILLQLPKEKAINSSMCALIADLALGVVSLEFVQTTTKHMRINEHSNLEKLVVHFISEQDEIQRHMYRKMKSLNKENDRVELQMNIFNKFIMNARELS